MALSPKGKMPLKKTAAKGPVSKGTVVPAGKPSGPAGFPAQQAKAYAPAGKAVDAFKPPKKKTRSK